MLVGESMIGKEKIVDIGNKGIAVKAMLVCRLALNQLDRSHSHLREGNLD